MRDRPILFSAPMVRAILAGRKNQTRRALKLRKGVMLGDEQWPREAVEEPRIAVGDRLWVREAWAPLDALTHGDPGVQGLIDRGFYRADESTIEGEIRKWRPSIHMPRWASRLTLAVTDVRVQRLWEITDADAMAEGVECRRDGGWGVWDQDGRCICGGADHPREGFRCLWININGNGSWEANPWVAAYAFTVEQRNIDA